MKPKEKAKEIIYKFPNEIDQPNKGMELRQYIAIKAMQGIISSTRGIGLEINEKHIEIVSKKAVMYADGLLKALLKS